MFAIVACGSSPAFAQLTTLRVPDVSTMSPTFQTVPGSTFTVAPTGGETRLILVQGQLSASQVGFPAGELQIVDMGGLAWVSATVDTNVIGTPQPFMLLDATNSLVVLHAELRSPAGATVQLSGLSYFTLRGLGGAQLVEQGALSKQYVDAGWQTAVTITVDTAQEWVLLAVSAVRSLSQGVPVAVRLFASPDIDSPPSLSGTVGDPTGYFLSGSTGFHGFFTPINANMSASSFSLQVDPDPDQRGQHRRAEGGPDLRVQWIERRN